MISAPVLFVLEALAVLAVAPLTVGLTRTVKARYQNRRGASMFQPYLALAALLRKEMTVSEHASWVFRFTPYAVLAATVAFVLVMPALAIGLLPAALTNIFLAVSLLALASTFLVFGALDAASAFGDMGASREMTLVALGEAAFLVALATLGFLAGTGSTAGILAAFAAAPSTHVLALGAPTLLALLFIALAENARYPVDNPATHLELTMVHEALILEYSGPYLAMLEYASALRLTALGVFLANLLSPSTLVAPGVSVGAVGLALVAFLAKIALVAFVVATLESFLVKMRFYRMQEYFSMAFFLALAGAALAFASVFFL